MTDRRVEIERLREKAAVAYDKLTDALDADGHGPWCILRCIEDWASDHTHECPVCGEDEGTS